MTRKASPDLPGNGQIGVRGWLFGITAAKIVTFLVLVLLFHVQPFVGDNASDYFIPIAHRIVASGSFNDTATRDLSSVPPGYPFFLAGMYRLAGQFALPAVVCVQMLADLLTAICLLTIGKRFGRADLGAVAAVLWLIFPPAVGISTWVTPESLFSALFIASITVLIVGNLSFPWIPGLAALLLGIATLIRGNTLLFPVAYAAYWVWHRRYLAGVAFAMVFALAVGVWTVRNWVVLDDPIVVSTSFGSAFMQGSDDRYYQHKAREYPALAREVEAAGITRPRIETGSNMNRWMMRIGIFNYRRRLHDRGVFAVLAQLGRKLLYMWFLTESGNLREEVLLAICSVIVVPLGLWELFRWSRQGEGRSLIAITVGFWIAIHLLVVPIARYTLPIFPLILLAACFGAESLEYRKIRPPRTTPIEALR